MSDLLPPALDAQTVPRFLAALDDAFYPTPNAGFTARLAVLAALTSLCVLLSLFLDLFKHTLTLSHLQVDAPERSVPRAALPLDPRAAPAALSLARALPRPPERPLPRHQVRRLSLPPLIVPPRCPLTHEPMQHPPLVDHQHLPVLGVPARLPRRVLARVRPARVAVRLGRPESVHRRLPVCRGVAHLVVGLDGASRLLVPARFRTQLRASAVELTPPLRLQAFLLAVEPEKVYISARTANLLFFGGGLLLFSVNLVRPPPPLPRPSPTLALTPRAREQVIAIVTAIYGVRTFDRYLDLRAALLALEASLAGRAPTLLDLLALKAPSEALVSAGNAARMCVALLSL